MTDMLVKLYDLPPAPPVQAGVVRRVMAPERSLVETWIEGRFSRGWADEFLTAAARTPASVFISVQEDRMTGFACYDATALGMFGPTGVDDAARGQGLGKALLFACLEDMRARGYAYAVVGWVSSEDYYRQAVGAEPIPNSTPGPYKGLLPSGG